MVKPYDPTEWKNLSLRAMSRLGRQGVTGLSVIGGEATETFLPDLPRHSEDLLYNHHE